VCLTIEFLHTDPRPRIHRKIQPSPPLAVTTPRTLGGGSSEITGCASESLRLVLKDDGLWGGGLGGIWRAISIHTYPPSYIGMSNSFQFLSYMIVSPVQFVRILLYASRMIRRVSCEVHTGVSERRASALRYVGVMWFLFHVLQLLLIRFTQQNSHWISRSTTNICKDRPSFDSRYGYWKCMFVDFFTGCIGPPNCVYYFV
jgi:hypothetical protein